MINREEQFRSELEGIEMVENKLIDNLNKGLPNKMVTDDLHNRCLNAFLEYSDTSNIDNFRRLLTDVDNLDGINEFIDEYYPSMNMGNSRGNNKVKQLNDGKVHFLPNDNMVA